MLGQYTWFSKVVESLQAVEAQAIDPGVPGAAALIRLAQSYLDWAEYYTHDCRLDLSVVEGRLEKALRILTGVRKAWQWYDGTPSYQSERLEAYLEAVDALLAAIRGEQQGDEEPAYEELSEELLEEPLEGEAAVH